jgi:hypothetical protein
MNPPSYLIHAATLLLAVSATSATSTRVTGPLYLSEQDQQILGDTACNTHPQEIQTSESVGVTEPVHYGVVYCGPHAEDAGRPIGLKVGCSRPQGREYWECQKATPFVEMKIGDRTARMLYQYTTAKEVVEIVEFLLSRPKFRDAVVNPDWLVSDVYVYRSPQSSFVLAIDYRVRFSVMASGHSIQVIREKREDGTRFGIEGITVWHGYVGDRRVRSRRKTPGGTSAGRFNRCATAQSDPTWTVEAFGQQLRYGRLLDLEPCITL